VFYHNWWKTNLNVTEYSVNWDNQNNFYVNWQQNWSNTKWVSDYLSAILSGTFDLTTRTFTSSSIFRMSLTDKMSNWIQYYFLSVPF
jgi:hypothetical protein